MPSGAGELEGGGRQELELVAGLGKQGQSMQHALRIVG